MTKVMENDSLGLFKVPVVGIPLPILQFTDDPMISVQIRTMFDMYARF